MKRSSELYLDAVNLALSKLEFDEQVEIRINNCSLTPHTNENCFAFSNGTITKYYNHENNDNRNLSCPKNVIIPKKINGIEVKFIGVESFVALGIESVTIPNTVTTIKRHAFYNNKLTELTIPEGVTTIEGNAFYGNPLESVTIKNKKSNVSIDSTAFGTFAINNILWTIEE